MTDPEGPDIPSLTSAQGRAAPTYQQSFSRVTSPYGFGSLPRPGETGLEPFITFVCLGDQGGTDLSAISLQPGLWDCPNPGIDLAVHIHKCTYLC